MQRFPIAPMSTAIRGMTFLLLALPVGFALAGAPLSWVGLGLALLYLALWLAARPLRFEVEGPALRVCFPLWTRSIPRASIASARVLAGSALREQLGFAVRVGAGGLWGGFGWLWSSRRRWVELYVSRSDGLVWIERRGALPLLITPERPAELVASLGGEAAR